MRRGAASVRVAWGFFGAALLLCAATAAPFVSEQRVEWRRVQRRFTAVTGRPAPGVRELSPRGVPERCPTCHLGLGDVGAAAAARPRILRPHPAILEQHPPERDGCIACHGGGGRALDGAGAHPWRGPEELLRGPLIAAGCPRCHTLGAVDGDRPVREGLGLFVDLGCIACHRAGHLDVQSEFGPDLSAIGRRGSAYLRRVVREPSRMFPGTKMPDFAPALTDRDREDALVTYLLSLRGEPRRSEPRSAIPCASCHHGERPSGLAGGHRCVFIRERRAALACGRCHGAAPPAATRECRFIAKQRFVCGACHGSGSDA